MRIDKNKLESLKSDAMAAAEENGKSWSLEEDKEGFQIYGILENPTLQDISRKFSKQPEYISQDICGGRSLECGDSGYEVPGATAKHITNFDPETAIDLLKQLALAEASLEKIAKAVSKAQKHTKLYSESERNAKLLKDIEKILELVKLTQPSIRKY